MDSEADELDPDQPKPDKAECIKAIDLKYCNKDKDGDPIMEGGNSYKLSPENMGKFSQACENKMEKEVVFDMDKIIITSAVLNEMNKGATPAEAINIADMFILEKIFNFVE